MACIYPRRPAFRLGGRRYFCPRTGKGVYLAVHAFPELLLMFPLGFLDNHVQYGTPTPDGHSFLFFLLSWEDGLILSTASI